MTEVDRMRVMAAVLLLAALTGCAAPAPTASPPSAPMTEVEGAAALPAFDLLDCEGDFVFFVFDDAAVEAQMPAGYRAYTVQGYAGALVGLDAMTCDVLVDGSLAERVPIVRTFVQVGPTTMYGFEWIFPVERAPGLADWLSSHGWAVLDAQVEMPPGLITVRGAEVDYVVADIGLVAGGPVPSSASGDVVHFVHGDLPVRLDENQTYHEGASVSASVPSLLAANGALARFSPGGVAPASASGGLSFLGVRLDSHFTVPPADGTVEPIRT